MHLSYWLSVGMSKTESGVRGRLHRRWEPSSAEFQCAEAYLTQRAYHRALDELQRLVVLRLFELQKLNISQTGMLSYHLLIIC